MGILVTGLPKLNMCALGKNTKGSFQNSLSKTKHTLELGHSDLCGPMSTPSKGGALYHVIFVDDFSRKTWTYFLKFKKSEEILYRFKEFKALIGNSFRKKIKILRTDNGKQYTSKIIKQFFVTAGIKR